MSTRNYSYFIIKPDGVRKFPEIAEIIENEFSSVRYYKIEDFQNLIKKIYFKHYEKKGEKFSKSFNAYLYGLENLYGNEGIAIIVSQNAQETSYEDFTKKVFNIKLFIRNQYSNPNIAIATNYMKGTGEPNYIKFVTEEGIQSNPRVLSELGHHRLSDLNIIHCPDANVKDTLLELNILCKENIIEENNQLEPHMINEAKQYRSVSGCCKEYKEVKLDISGFIKGEIVTWERE